MMMGRWRRERGGGNVTSCSLHIKISKLRNGTGTQCNSREENRKRDGKSFPAGCLEEIPGVEVEGGGVVEGGWVGIGLGMGG